MAGDVGQSPVDDALIEDVQAKWTPRSRHVASSRSAEPRRRRRILRVSDHPSRLYPDTSPTTPATARMRGLRMVIAGAGLSAALPGVVAAHTNLPVIGVPVRGPMSIADGLDALLALAPMPGACRWRAWAWTTRNGAVLAARILGA
jgi:hypothetical protein